MSAGWRSAPAGCRRSADGSPALPRRADALSAKASTVWSTRLSSGTVNSTRLPLLERAVDDRRGEQRLAGPGRRLQHRSLLPSQARGPQTRPVRQSESGNKLAMSAELSQLRVHDPSSFSGKSPHQVSWIKFLRDAPVAFGERPGQWVIDRAAVNAYQPGGMDLGLIGRRLQITLRPAQVHWPINRRQLFVGPLVAEHPFAELVDDLATNEWSAPPYGPIDWSSKWNGLVELTARDLLPPSLTIKRPTSVALGARHARTIRTTVASVTVVQ